MTKNKFTIKKLTLILLVVAMLVFQQLITLFGVLDFSKKSILADSNTITEISISNSNFTSSSGTGLGEPSSFTPVGTKGSTVSGVINTDPKTFSENKETYKLNYNPSHPKSSSDNKVLMINNQNLQPSYYGYESSTFTLAKNGYYYVSTYVYTEYSDVVSIASLYLSNTNLDKLDTSKIENISTKGVWKEYRFYVRTNQEDQTVSLKLFIGSLNSFKSSGAVFFDNISAFSLSEADYYTHIKNSNSENSEIIFSNKDVSVSNGILDGDFTSLTLKDFTKVESSSVSSNNIAKIVGIGDYFDENDSKVSVNPTSANRTNNKYALLINNSVPSYTAFKSKDILIEQHKLYKLSVDVKTSNFVSGGAKLLLEQKNPFDKDDFTPVSSSQDSINTSSETNSIKNDWITYNFYISGNAFKNSYANLTLALDENAQGYVFFDNITIEEITTSEYDNNSSSSNSKSVDFSNLTESPSISNGAFNNVKIEDTENNYPYPAKDMTVTNENTDNFNGIINVNSQNFNKQNYPFINPVSINSSNADLSYNNIFVLANVKRDYQILKTSDFSLSSSSLDSSNYYKVNFALNTQSIIDYGVNVTLKTTDGEVLANLRNINTSNKWQIISIFVKTSDSAKTCNLEISLGSKLNLAKGFAFVDDLRLDTSSKDEYDLTTSSQYTYKTDLENVDLSLRSENNSNNYYTSNNFTGTNNSNSNCEAGVINVTTHPTLNVGSVKSDYVLAIHNIGDGYYTLKSNAYKLTSGKKYKITVSVKTLNLKQDDANKQQDDNNKDIPYGAKIELSGIDASVNGIVSEQEYQTYTFYVNATNDSTIYFNLSLGDEKALTSGYAFFDNLSVKLISDDDFTNASKKKLDTDKTTLIIGDTDTKNDDNNNNNTETTSTNFDWLVIPTLIIAIALLIAMVGALIRKLNIKMPTRVKAVKDYDRAKTLVKDMEKRERIKQREEKLKDLRNKLQQIEDELYATKEVYKNSKLLKEEIKVEHEKVEQKIKDAFKDTTTIEAIRSERKLKNEAKQRVKQERKAKYLEKRNQLITKYLEIEKEIDLILEEERLLVEEWKAYKKQQKADKLASKKK